MREVHDKLQSLGKAARERIEFFGGKLTEIGKAGIDHLQKHRTTGIGRKWQYAAVVAGVVLAVLLRGAAVAIFSNSDKPLPPVQLKFPATAPSTPDLRGVVEGRLKPDLDWAQRESEKSVDDRLQQLDDFFTAVKKRTPRFAKDALGWGSEWYLVLDKMPRTRTDRQALYLKKAFNDDIFSPEQLTKALDQVVKDYVDSEAGIENQMLVKMRADVSDLPPAFLASFGNQGELRVAFDRALALVKERSGANLKADVSREVTSTVVAQVMIWVAERMGVEAGILTVGASNSWETLGVSMVVALAVDQVVKWVWQHYRDPVGELTKKINDKLDDLHHLIVEGDNEDVGLRARLKELSAKRADLRRAAVEKLVPSTEKP